LNEKSLFQFDFYSDIAEVLTRNHFLVQLPIQSVYLFIVQIL